MKNIILFTVFVFYAAYCVIAQTAPDKNNNTNNSRNSLNWDGIYRGILPCADCEGLQETIYLNRDMSFRMDTKYLGKSDTVYSYSGKFSWNKKGNMIILNAAGRRPEYFLVGENMLTQSDQNGKKMDAGSAGQFILSKAQFAVVEKYWKLVELDGRAIVMDSTLNKEPHVIFKNKDYKITGNGGCNNFSGVYMLQGVDKIAISKVAATLMACPATTIETTFIKSLEAARNFQINGDMLSLKTDDGKVLAKFKAVQMKAIVKM